jgi:S-formylglutathione hydrolase FrmB
VLPTLAAAVSALALVPGFSVMSTGPAGGVVMSGSIPGTPRQTLVYLPPGYGQTAQRYPVVYLLHGLPGDPTEYVDGAGLLQFADTQIEQGRMEPFVAVMPPAGATAAYGGEWAGRYEREVVDDVVPWSDTHLLTVRTRSARTIGGLSAGGFGAVDIALRHPRLFGAVASWSGYFTPLRDQPFRNAPPAVLAAHDPVLLARRRAPLLRREHTQFFLSTGPTHSHLIPASATVAFASELHALGLHVALMRYPALRGEWRAQVQAGLAWAFAAMPAAA